MEIFLIRLLSIFIIEALSTLYNVAILLLLNPDKYKDFISPYFSSSNSLLFPSPPIVKLYPLLNVSYLAI